jgi:DNA modification methylase
VKPYYEHAGITIYHGDCREVLPSLDGDVIVCDPPYGRNVELSRRGGLTIKGDSDTSLRDWIINRSPRCLLFGSPFIIRPQCKAVLVWDKSELTGMGDLNFPWKITHEEIYVFGDGFKSKRRRGSVLRHPLRPSWANHPDSISGLHPTEKPVSLMMDLLDCCPWMEIIDPACGTGATLQAAKNLGKLAMGIEIEEKYCEIAAKRLSQEVMSFE